MGIPSRVTLEFVHVIDQLERVASVVNDQDAAEIPLSTGVADCNIETPF